MKKVLFILMPKDYQEREFNKPYQQLTAAGHTVDVAGLQPGNAIGHQGATFTPNKLLIEMTEQDFASYDALVITGGPGSTTYLWNNELIKKTIRFFHDHGKLVATICYACIAAVQAGILKNKCATVYPTDEAKAILVQHQVTFVQDGCVVLEQEKIITGQGPQFANDFAQAIIKILG